MTDRFIPHPKERSHVERQQVRVRLKTSFVDHLDVVSHAANCSRNQLIIDALEYAVAHALECAETPAE